MQKCCLLPDRLVNRMSCIKELHPLLISSQIDFMHWKQSMQAQPFFYTYICSLSQLNSQADVTIRNAIKFMSSSNGWISAVLQNGHIFHNIDV